MCKVGFPHLGKQTFVMERGVRDAARGCAVVTLAGVRQTGECSSIHLYFLTAEKISS